MNGNQIKEKLNDILATHRFQDLRYTSVDMCSALSRKSRIDKSPIHYRNSLTRMSVTRDSIFHKINLRIYENKRKIK